MHFSSLPPSSRLELTDVIACRFSLIKILAIVGLIIVSLIITAGGVPTSDPTEYPIGFRCEFDRSDQYLWFNGRSADPLGPRLQTGTPRRSSS